MAKLPIPFDNPRTYPGHSGIDFAQPRGKVFRASGPGTVKTRSRNDRGGYYVWVQYDGGPLTGYHHMDSHNGVPGVGSRTVEGTQLGYVGNTGNSTGPHLHSEVADNPTTAGYWAWFDGNRVVGVGAVSGSIDTTTEKQVFLKTLGLYAGDIDGIWGPQSKAGTSTFQSLTGLDVDGDFGPKTTAVADIIQAGRNASGKSTQEVQQKLKDKGFDPGPVDNQWGNKTSLATYRYQKSIGLAADAICGEMTTAQLFKVDVPVPPPVTEPVGSNQTSRATSQVQEALKAKGLYTGDIDGVYGPLMTAAVKAFQKQEGIVEDGIYGLTSDGLLFKPAGSIHGIDYSFARPDPAMLKSRGVKLVGRYLWPERFNTKGITKAELDALHAQDIEVFFIYEKDGKELKGGFTAGVQVAQEAEAELKLLGLAGHPIYFNVDYDAGVDDMPAIFDALDGIESVIGIERVGLYAGYNVIRQAFDRGSIRWGFQTYAWSGGNWDPRAQLQQWSNGQWGGSIDFTRAMVEEYGQNPVVILPPDPDPEPEPEEPTLAEKIEAAYKVLGEAYTALGELLEQLP